MKKRHLSVMPGVILALLLTGLLIACPGANGPATVAVTGVSIDQEVTEPVAIGDTIELTATVSPGGATDSAVIWVSGDPTIATVENVGGLATGKPGARVKGVAGGTVTITATARDGSLVKADIVITVSDSNNNAPTVSTEIPDVATGTMTIGVAIQTIYVSGNFEDADNDTLTFSATGLPVGLTISDAGEITGTPTGNAGTATVTVTANDGNGGTVSDIFEIVVDAATVTNNAPTVSTEISDVATGTMTIGVAIQTIDVSGNFEDADNDTLTFSATGLPAGLAISGAGEITGTPTGNAGTATVTVTANDGNGGTVSDIFEIVVDAATTPTNVASTMTVDITGASEYWVAADVSKDVFINAITDGTADSGVAIRGAATITFGTNGGLAYSGGSVNLLYEEGSGNVPAAENVATISYYRNGTASNANDFDQVILSWTQAQTDAVKDGWHYLNEVEILAVAQ